MRSYEVACVFHGDDAVFNRGKETVKEELTKLGARISGEEDLGQRTLAYPIKKETRGHYWIYSVEMDPPQAKQIEHALRLTSELLRVLVIKKDGK
ncbi:MAG: 30S ribosomal protein S6 [Spirochaetales bacterium]